ncbi:MAG: hypothetical protein GNW80_15545 [Asgard group archaeon]|nr:hypothetical protein [Asgard group archaeon]
MFEVKQDVLNWLLEDNNPPIQYLTLIILLDKEANSSEALDAKNRIMTYKPIIEILTNQKENSYWYDKRKDQNYKKYLGTFWQLIFLSNIHAEKNEQISNGIEHIFSTGQPLNGGFSVSGTNSLVITCLTANILRSLIHFGYWNDERTGKALEYLLANFVDTNGKIRCQPTGLISDCYMTLPKILHAFSAIAKEDRTTRVTKGINLCVDRMLENQIYKYLPEKNREYMKTIAELKLSGQDLVDKKKEFLKNNPDMKHIAKSSWTKFGFPLSYTSDVLDAMKALVSAEVKYSSKMRDALDLIKSKQVNGKWINEKQYKSPMYTTIELYQKESKWLTLHALEVLKYYEGLKIVD